MATIRSLSESLGVLKRNPLLFAIGVLYAVIVLPQSALALLGIPLVPRLLQMVTFFVTPFVIAGLLAMAYEGTKRPASLSTFKKVGKDRYARVLVGNLIKFVLDLVFGIVLVVVVFLTVGLGMAAAMNGGGDPSSALMGSVGVVAIAAIAAVVLLFLILSFFVQFYAVAYVVDDVGVVDGFARSIGVVKGNLVSALGFGVVNLIVGVLLFLPVVGIVLIPFLTGGMGSGAGVGAGTQSASAFGTPLLLQAGVVVYSFVVSVLMVPFRSTFSVTFYENHT